MTLNFWKGAKLATTYRQNVLNSNPIFTPLDLFVLSAVGLRRPSGKRLVGAKLSSGRWSTDVRFSNSVWSFAKEEIKGSTISLKN